MTRFALTFLLLVSMCHGQEPNNTDRKDITIAKLEKKLRENGNLIARLKEDLEEVRQENERLKGLCKRYGVNDSIKDYAPKEKPQTNNTIPSKVHAQIRQKAQSEWPNNFGMQKFTIENELKAYRSLQNMPYVGVPKNAFLQIRQKAQSEWPNDFGMQKFTIENELKAYRSLGGSHLHSQKINEKPSQDVPSIILRKIKQTVMREYPDNYSIQEMLIESEVEAYKFVKSYNNKQVPLSILRKIKQKVTREFPNNYSVQQMLIESEVESYINLNN